ncbi:phospholipid-transporting ATPase 8 [Spatholobus suberectus]|nr:phospholipid-transporting ATPase 8 [Spatholobus suberectus]
MSVIVRNEENQLLLLCKGADSVMFERLSQHGRQFEAETRDHIKRYAEAGLRTLVITYRELDEEGYKLWDKEFTKIKTTVSQDRDVLVDAAADKMERDLILLGATAVEDRLQKGVPECIEKLAQAKIKIELLEVTMIKPECGIRY